MQRINAQTSARVTVNQKAADGTRRYMARVEILGTPAAVAAARDIVQNTIATTPARRSSDGSTAPGYVYDAGGGIVQASGLVVYPTPYGEIPLHPLIPLQIPSFPPNPFICQSRGIVPMCRCAAAAGGYMAAPYSPASSPHGTPSPPHGAVHLGVVRPPLANAIATPAAYPAMSSAAVYYPTPLSAYPPPRTAAAPMGASTHPVATPPSHMPTPAAAAAAAAAPPEASQSPQLAGASLGATAAAPHPQ